MTLIHPMIAIAATEMSVLTVSMPDWVTPKRFTPFAGFSRDQSNRSASGASDQPP